MAKNDTKAKEIIHKGAGQLLGLAKGLEDPLLAQLLSMIVKAADDDAMRYLKVVAERRTEDQDGLTVH